ncbi:MAG: bifunctional (p)ppGpp synthetase/guanosine-3',5'-bis(diphosphate) 3'-pyrophosphohydrolase [Candidatus Dadabacteria bacterium]|nr:bifunctional (p)ppGpp synthetase/guanosine-3',5'-bis(diphosphate) 3'-pyrophosphohydrolase [Candidatus Dadabacteria bacterium]
MIRLNDIIDKVTSYSDIANDDLDSIKKAYVYSAKVHSGQKRVSGEPYLSHPLEVSSILANMKLDVPSIVTGLLHDTIEDTLATREEIERIFGNEIAFLVDATTKISLLPYVSDVEKQAESFRKLILATAEDIRVVLIKLADRLHNMRTLEYLTEERRRRIAIETMEIYAPLAHRLGMNWISVELEDLAFKFSKPSEYERISKNVSAKKKDWEKYTAEIVSLITAKMEEFEICGDVSWRFKHLYGIYSKMKKGNISLSNIYDILGFRIVTATENECYQVLGAVHSLWKPIPGTIKDYIALPKANNYQSIHTAVIGPFGEQMEIQIRTEKMHRIAEYGVAAHWRYKQGNSLENGNDKIYSNLRHLVELKDIKDSTEYIEAIKGELILDVVYVYTPNADLLEFPVGSTPVDFAYSIHTDIGNHCSQAFVNHKLVPLNYKLKTGDMVEVMTSRNRVPNRQWLDFVVTSKAKNRIRSWLRKEENCKAEQIGEAITQRKLAAKGFNLRHLREKKRFEESLAKLQFSEVNDFYRAVGFGNASVNDLLKVMHPRKFAEVAEKSKRIKSIINRISKDESKDAVLVKKYDNILIKFAKCCNPVPGERIIGFITRGRGITVHVYNCPKLLEVDPERRIDVAWNDDYSGRIPISLSVRCENRKGMLSELTSAVSGLNVDIVSADISKDEIGQGDAKFEVAVENIKQLEKLVESLKNLGGVISVERLTCTS